MNSDDMLTDPITSVEYHENVLDHVDAKVRGKIEDAGGSVNTWKDPPNTTHPSHDHSYSHRVLCVDGWIEFQVQDRSYRLSPGDVLDLPKNISHSARTSPDTSTSYWLIQPP